MLVLGVVVGEAEEVEGERWERVELAWDGETETRVAIVKQM